MLTEPDVFPNHSAFSFCLFQLVLFVCFWDMWEGVDRHQTDRKTDRMPDYEALAGLELDT